MKRLRIIFNSFKESFHNFLKHPLVTFASITTMTLMLTLLGCFVLFSLNITHMVTNISKQPPIEVYANLNATAEDIAGIEASIKAFEGVNSLQSVTPEENLQKFIEGLKTEEETFKHFDARNIPHSFVVRLNNPELSHSFKLRMEAIPSVYLVDFSENIMQLLASANRLVRLITLGVLVVLGIVCFFVISNMVRISVFSRGEEIQIMKYVGATNSYIRFPYILEGFFVGVLGAALSSLILFFAYREVYAILMSNSSTFEFFSLRMDNELGITVAVILASLGIGVGMLASGISVRQHIKV